MPEQAIDLVIEARWIVPVEPDGVVLDHHAVAIDGGRIVDLGPQSEIAARFSPRRLKRLPRHVLIPVW